MARWVRLFTLLSIALKLDGYVDWSWSETIWPLWVVACFIALVSVGVFVLTVSALCSYFTDGTNKDELIAALWLFYSVNGSLAAFGAVCLQAFHHEEQPVMEVVFCLVFLAGFLTFTGLAYPRLLRWWTSFFIIEGEELQDDEEEEESNAHLPHPTLSSQIRAAIKAPPRMLLRLSSSYFQPTHVVPTQQLPPKRRTASGQDQKTVVEEEEPNPTTTHRRYQSSAVRAVGSPRMQLVRRPSNYAYSGDSQGEAVCDMCCENASNAVIMECGHGGLCYDCSLVLWKATAACHMCRNPISQVLQIKTDPGSIVKVISTTRAVYGPQP